MIKKIGFTLFVLIALILAYFGYHKLILSKEPNAIVAEHIPDNAVCVIETKQCQNIITELTQQNLIWKALLTNDDIVTVNTQLHYFDSLIYSNKLIENLINGNSFFLSFFKNGNETQNILQCKLKEQNDDQAIELYFKTYFKVNTTLSSFKAYNFNIGNSHYLISLNNGIIYCSADAQLLQTCINLEKEKSVSENKNYIALLKLNGKQTTQIYFNHTQLALFDKSILNKQSIFTANLALNQITFNGYALLDSLTFLYNLKNQTPISISNYNDFPNNPISFVCVGLSSTPVFVDDVERKKTNEQLITESQLWKQLNDSALYNIKNDYLDNLGNEISYANYFINNLTTKIHSVKIIDVEKATQLLKLMSDSVLQNNESIFYHIQPCYSSLFLSLNYNLKSNYAFIKNNYLYLFETKEAVLFFENCQKNGNVLGKNIEFVNYANNNFNNACNYIYYENTSQIKASNQASFFNSQLFFEANNPFSTLSFTAKHTNKNIQFRLTINHTSVDTSNVNTANESLWAFNAGADITSDGFMFTNHNTQQNELCFETAGNNLNLIDATGNLIWKKQLNEKLQSTIFTVDLFKNGKNQLLFNTQNYLHLIDRNGVYVQGFPIKTPSVITSNITLLDYDNTKDYRLMIACADKKIYNFSLYGIKTEGFMPVKTDAIVTTPIYYCKVGLSDYLVCNDVAGKLYVFSRKGDGRIDFENKVISSLKQMHVQVGNTIVNTKLYYLDDKNNLLNKISFTDKKETLKIGDDLNGFESLFELIDDDVQPDIVVFGNGAIYGYDLFSNKLFEYFNPQSVYSFVNLAETTAHTYVLATDTISKKIDIITTNGVYVKSIKAVSRKPLVCNLYKNDKLYALIINANKLSCVELN